MNTIWKRYWPEFQGRKDELILGPDNVRQNWFHWACYNPDVKVLQYIAELLQDLPLEEGLDSTDKFEKSVIHYACHYGTKEMVEYLLTNFNLSFDRKDRRNYTIFHYACMNKNVEVIQYLIDSGYLDHFYFTVQFLLKFTRKRDKQEECAKAREYLLSRAEPAGIPQNPGPNNSREGNES